MSTVTNTTPTRASISDLERVRSKAELIDGRIVDIMPSGYKPGRVALRIARSLDEHAERNGVGAALGDNVGFRVPELSSGRESFSPDAAYLVGPAPVDPMRFVDGPPTFAVEVRSESDYGPAAEREMAAKRADYFEAGTLVVWDVDPLAATVSKHSASDPTHSLVFHQGEEADAEPAVPRWRVAVEWIFL